MNTITVQDGTGASTAPALILGYQTARTSRSIVHDTLDGGIAVSLIPPRPRSGTLRLFYTEQADAFAALELHARVSTFALVSDERAPINMVYTVAGSDLRLELDEQTRHRWTLDVPYQEVVT